MNKTSIIAVLAILAIGITLAFAFPNFFKVAPGPIVSDSISSDQPNPEPQLDDEATDRAATAFQNYSTALCAAVADASLLNNFPTGYVRDTVNEYVTKKVAIPTDFDCSQFTSENFEAVKQLLTQDDDQDGLNSLLENLFETDLSKTDTDADGRDDLTEVRDQRNPIDSGEDAMLQNQDNPIILVHSLFVCIQENNTTAEECLFGTTTESTE